MLKIRASSLAEIMTDPKSANETLSVGAKTYIERLAKQNVYGFEDVMTSKYTEKGCIVENESIALYNSVFFTDHAKNEERRTNDWITGECDIYTGNKIIDIKSPWSLATFPATSEAGKDKTYEWQLRAYMWLWDVDEAEIAYCLVSTPDELIGWDNPDLHYVDHIDPALRVTIVPYTRDKAKEAKIIERVTAAQLYFDSLIARIKEEHFV